MKLSGAVHGVDGITEEVVAELDDLEGVFHTVKKPFGQPSQLVVREVGSDQRQIAGGEELRAQGLDAGVALREFLDVEAVGKERELGEYGVITVNDSCIEVVKSTHAWDVQRGMEV